MGGAWPGVCRTPPRSLLLPSQRAPWPRGVRRKREQDSGIIAIVSERDLGAVVPPELSFRGGDRWQTVSESGYFVIEPYQIQPFNK